MLHLYIVKILSGNIHEKQNEVADWSAKIFLSLKLSLFVAASKIFFIYPRNGWQYQFFGAIDYVLWKKTQEELYEQRSKDDLKLYLCNLR